MNNKLTEFIKENKKAFEVEGPSLALWNRIDSELIKQQKSKSRIKRYYWMKAAALLLLTVSVFILYRRNQNLPVKIADVNFAAKQKAVQFAHQIKEKKDSLAGFIQSDPELYAKFNNDLNLLANDYEKLKKQMQSSPNKATLVRAMLKNLELQLQVLNQQLIIFNQVEEYKKEKVI